MLDYFLVGKDLAPFWLSKTFLFKIFFVQIQVDGLAMKKAHLGLFSSSETVEKFFWKD